MLSTEIYRLPPKSLYHHTNFKAMCGILSCGIGADQEIGFRAVSNAWKNDDQEIALGEQLLNACKIIPNKLIPYTLFSKFNGYRNCGSVSFMEGPANQHMIDEYGPIRLCFDLRDVDLSEAIWDMCSCEYVSASLMPQYSKEFAKEIVELLHNLEEKHKMFGDGADELLPNLCTFFQCEIDILRKVFLIKEQKWECEQEWRIIREIVDNAPDTFYREDWAPYKMVYIPAITLKSISVYGDMFEDVKNFVYQYDCYKHVQIERAYL
ncbi:MAG: hypothetical protein KBS70_01090 [Bacteroidales bacterium]|nr:hypothetical protein [Candidatus Colicola equi]